MRVLFNCETARGQKTGVGVYSEQLLAHLGRFASCEVASFPPDYWLKWERRLHACYKVARSALETIRFRRTTNRSLYAGDSSGWTSQALRRWRSRWLERVLARRVADGIDLYHEPNHIPFACDCKTVTTFHDLAGVLHPEWHPAHRVDRYQRNIPRTLEQTAHFIAVSDFTRQQLIDELGVAPHKVTRVYSGIRQEFSDIRGVDVTNDLKRLNLPDRYLLYVGTIEPRKNVLLLMQAYCALPEPLRQSCPLLLAGRWGWRSRREYHYFESQARACGVVQLGYVPDAELPVLYRGARALVFPSHYEGFGFPVAEMLACGGAVLCSTAESLVEIARGQALFIDANDVDGWRQAMQRVIRDDDCWQGLQENAHRLARRYSWEQCARETVQVYDKVSVGTQGQSPLAA